MAQLGWSRLAPTRPSLRRQLRGWPQWPRLEGEALLAGAGTVSEAETAIEKGIDVARRQNAKSWELRGAMSLARLRRQQGRREEAAALLAPILGWFREGFDTADLKEAKTLLNELTEQPVAAEGE
jgi:predicted ATPase